MHPRQWRSLQGEKLLAGMIWARGRGRERYAGMRESSCPSLIQGEERGVFLELWRRAGWHAGLLSVSWLAFVIAPSCRGKALRHSSPCSSGLFYLPAGCHRHSLCPVFVAPSHSRGPFSRGVGWWSLWKPSPSRGVPAEHPQGRAAPLPSGAGTLLNGAKCELLRCPFGNGEVCSFPC